MNRLRTYIFLLCLIGWGSVWAQTGVYSPYSRYAYGLMSDYSSVAYRSMGGVSTGMRSNRVINPAQPASYTACDTMTFMFDVAAYVNWTQYRDGGGMRNKANGNLAYVTLQLPIWKKHIAMSLGLLPYSACGYDLTLNERIGESDYTYAKQYIGEGGISQVYGGLSGNLFNWVALGINVYYMFGDLENARYLAFDSPNVTDMVRASVLTVSSCRLRYGIQLFHTFDKHSFTVGAIYENPMKMNSHFNEASATYLDTVYYSSEGMKLPHIFAVGASYTWDDRLTVGIDFERQLWGGVGFLNNNSSFTIQLKDCNRLAIGVEYRHNRFGKNYAERMMWRAGFSMRDSYIKVMPMNELHVSMGLGFPLRNAGTNFNVAIEYIRRGANNTLKENGLQVTINAAIRETWFFKRKI